MKLNPTVKNDIAAKRYDEAVFSSIFDVRIKFPDAIDSSNSEIVIDNIIAVGGLTNEKMPADVVQKFKGTTRTKAGSVIDDTSHEIALTINLNLDSSNSMYSYNLFKRWANLVYNIETGERGLEVEYRAGTSIVIQLENKAGQVFRTYKGYDIYVNQPLPNIEELNYDNNDPVEPIVVSLRCDDLRVENNGL